MDTDVGAFRHTGAVSGRTSAEVANRMRPVRLVLDGFGSYRHETEIDFTGVDFFALVGPTGSGKSTVIDALCFALYGTIPRWDNEKEVRNALAPSANACTVSLIFELSGERYVAARQLQRDKHGKVTTKAARLERLDSSVPPDAPLGELLEASVEQLSDGPDQVKSKVSELLGLSYEHFTQSVLLPQGSFAEFLRATPANRQRLLVELLAFGVYKDIGQRARVRADRAAELRKIAEQDLDRLAGATPEAETAAKARVDALTTLVQTVDTSLAELADLDNQAAAARTAAADTTADARLLAALRVPAEVPGLARQIAAADSLVADCRIRLSEGERAAARATEVRSGLPDKATAQQQSGYYALRRELESEAEEQRAALAARAEQEAALAAQLQAAEEALSQAQGGLELAQRAHAAAGLAEVLHVGDECPVCRQLVTALPAHQAPVNVSAARTAVEAARKSQHQARTAHQDAARATASARSVADGTGARLDKAAQVMAGVAPEGELTAQLEAIAIADDIVARTQTQAAGLRTELAAAERSRAALGADEAKARAKLGTERDKLVGLGAPAVGTGGEGLAEAWAALTAWAQAEREKRDRQLPELNETAAKLQQRLADAVGALAGLLAEHDITAVEPPARIPTVVAEQRVRAESELGRIREDRRKAARLDKEMAARKEEADVAGMLGNLLKANRFESWLCSEALDSLITEASATLMELSGGQYELDQDERTHDLVVIDYADAGTTRPVHTLSGGETFQASLALALALSRQVIGLSAGLRELNSMFLDEGFGTLDTDTLDTVASTLERLAADSDRMVGVITHVSELAARVPVRFLVSRSGTTSAIVREAS
jgi:DNA repair protein SbcC/Rad50